MSLLLTRADRLRLFGFDDRCALLVGVPLLAGVTFIIFGAAEWSEGSGLLSYCYLASLVHVTLYWAGLRGVMIFLRYHLPEQADITKRMVSYLGLSSVVVLSLVALSRVVMPVVAPQLVAAGWGVASFTFEFVISFTLGIMVAAIYESIYFFTKYRESEVARERLAKENVKGQLAVLKQQMNPHFLFNSLNTLTNIIPEDGQTATLFTQRLAAVYRRILEWRHKELITLEEEVLALQDYVFLMQTRFEDKLSVCWQLGARAQVQCEDRNSRVAVPPTYRNYRLVPLSIQLLVENAIKHNVVARDAPLRIDIVLTGDRITVRNPLNLRSDSHLNSTGWGHQNLKARYAAVTTEEVLVRQTATHYEVSLPVFPAVPAQRRRVATA